ncbi:hypothetical protein P7K49_035661 [Saguinus oedipus]|uniref:Uncharacterized protein n=1 Tax=Saguinus oedipus TaxID=9490 RepID=A0ABQ9TN79_SAGOE|nr:hypothetical protein P7K49_035661 [Saguinus oedipus]
MTPRTAGAGQDAARIRRAAWERESCLDPGTREPLAGDSQASGTLGDAPGRVPVNHPPILARWRAIELVEPSSRPRLSCSRSHSEPPHLPAPPRSPPLGQGARGRGPGLYLDWNLDFCRLTVIITCSCTRCRPDVPVFIFWSDGKASVEWSWSWKHSYAKAWQEAGGAGRGRGERRALRACSSRAQRLPGSRQLLLAPPPWLVPLWHWRGPPSARGCRALPLGANALGGKAARPPCGTLGAFLLALSFSPFPLPMS